MSETELTEREAARLRDLLHRAADGLEVTTPTPDAALARRAPRRSGSGRRLAAAAVVVLAGVGALWWWGDSGEERVDTSPADPAVTVAPQVLEERGIWRLPEGLDGYRVHSATTSSSVRALLIAVDDVDEPTRWLSLADHGVEIPIDGSTRVVELTEGLELLLRPVEGEEGITRFGLRVGASSAYVTGTFHGLDEEEVVEVLATTFGDVEAFVDGERRAEALARFRPPGGLKPTWGPGDASFDPSGVTVLTLADDDGEVAVTMERTGLPSAVAALRLRLVMFDLAAMGGPGGSALAQEMDAREDLGPHVFHLRFRIDGRPAGVNASQLVVVSADGTVIGVARVARQDEISTAEPLQEAEQLRIVNSLRAMPAEDFRTAVDAAGAQLVEPGSEVAPDGVPTTIQGGPVSTTTTEP